MLNGPNHRLSQHPSVSMLESMQTALCEWYVCVNMCIVTVTIYWTLWTQGGSDGKIMPLLCFSFLKWGRPKGRRSRGNVSAKIEGEGEHAIYRLGLHLRVVCRSFSSN